MFESRRAVVATGLLTVALFACVTFAPSSVAPRSLDDNLPCLDIWENDWCETKKDEGECSNNAVLSKCAGTCGACCLDRSSKTICEKMHDDDLCPNDSSDCMKTCGTCQLALDLSCSFEKEIDGEKDTCLYEQDADAVDDEFQILTWNVKLWTGPRQASHKDHFFLLDSEETNEGDIYHLTSPWGTVEDSALLQFSYNLYSRDYPAAMGSLAIEVLSDRSGAGWVEIWQSTGSDNGDQWTEDYIDLEQYSAAPLRIRFRFVAGADRLSDIALDNIGMVNRVCGDGERVYEQCDDSNANSKDGCDSCTVSEGYWCTKNHGAPDSCVKLACGDGVVSDGEECDDGNKVNGDGCSKDCTLEEGYYCHHPPVHCMDASKPELGQDLCYPGPSDCFPVYERKPRIRHDLFDEPRKGTKNGEPYEEGVLEIFEGGEFKGVCAGAQTWKLAQVACYEMGYAVGKVGVTFESLDCQDGFGQGFGMSDDCHQYKWGASWTHDFDCTHEDRKVGDCELCDNAGCTHAITVQCEYSGLCGDGFRRHTFEACDDGNTENGDGCNSDCQVEDSWVCAGGSWTSKDECYQPICGDGIRTKTEGCDDGNSENGDGCSSTCTVEHEWCCEGEGTETSSCTAFGTMRMKPGTSMERGDDIMGLVELLGPQQGETCGWGSVCAKDFSLLSGKVACEQIGQSHMGRAMFIRNTLSNDVVEPVEFVGVACEGTEDSLYGCSRCPFDWDRYVYDIAEKTDCAGDVLEYLEGTVEQNYYGAMYPFEHGYKPGEKGVEDCMRLCYDSPSCTGFTWYDESCEYRKASDTAASEDADSTCYTLGNGKWGGTNPGNEECPHPCDKRQCTKCTEALTLVCTAHP